MKICRYHNFNQIQLNYISQKLNNARLTDIASIIREIISDEFHVFVVPNEKYNSKNHIMFYIELKYYNPKFTLRRNWINKYFYCIQGYKNIYFLDPKFYTLWFYDFDY